MKKNKGNKKFSLANPSLVLGTMILVGGISPVAANISPVYAAEGDVVTNSEAVCKLNGSSQVTDVDYTAGTYTQYVYVNTDRESLNDLLLFIEANVVDDSSVIIQDATTTKVEIYADPNNTLVPGQPVDYSQLTQQLTPVDYYAEMNQLGVNFGNVNTGYLLKIDGTFDTSSIYDLVIKTMLVGTDGAGVDCQIDLDNVVPKEAPTTEAPTTEAPTTEAPTTEAPTTEAPTTEAPTTEAPTTEAPTTEAPTTEAPTTEAPTTEAPTTEAPTTEAPTPDEPPTIVNTGNNELVVGDSFDPMADVIAMDKEDGDITSDIIVESNNVDTSVPGTYQVIYKVTDSKGNTFTFTRNILVKAQVAPNEVPTITSAGSNNIVEGEAFDPMADVTASDAEDGDLTSEIKIVSNNVDTSTPGTYEIVYQVTDSQGNTMTLTRSIIVSPSTVSNNVPKITSAGSNNLMKGEAFDPMADVTASDVEDGDLTSSIEIVSNNVDTAIPGTYEIVYRVTDSDGNTFDLTRNILVSEAPTTDEPPTIVNTGNNELVVGDSFDPMADVIAMDKEDGDITSDIIVESNNVDTSVPGTYQVIYKVTDSKGNTFTFTRNILVKAQVAPNEVPTITSAGSNNIVEGEAFDPMADVTASDAEDGDLTSEIKIVSNNVDTSTPGTYEIVYQVTDSQGNTMTLTRSIIVSPSTVSNNVPKITSAGSNNLMKGEAFDPMADVTASDVEDGDLTSSIEIVSNNVDTAIPGTYEIVYRVTDSDGNTFDLTRNILVSEAPTTEEPTTEEPTTEEPTTEAPTTEVPTTEVPTTEVPTTEVPTTEVPTTEVPTTEVPTTEVPTTEEPTTEVPTTEVPTTEVPTTEVPTTEVPTTEMPLPTTEVPTTEMPLPTTEAPTTEMPLPTTEAPTTEMPLPTTEAPTTEMPLPTTEAPTTEMPLPTTEAPTTEMPLPTTEAPTTEMPLPTTEVPTTEMPLPTTEAPTTEVPTTEVPTTEAPTTEVPTTEAPTTEAPTTEAPTDAAPVIKSTASNNLIVGDTFDPLDGMVATDPEDGDLTSNIEVISNNVDTSVPGTYQVIYKVFDSKGNSFTFTRNLLVSAQNTPNEIPTITSTGSNNVVIGSEFDPMANVTAMDKEDGDLTSKITIVSNNVDTSKPGTYQVVYRVTDSNGSTMTFTRNILVSEQAGTNNVPVITSANSNKFNVGDKFDPLLGVEATDAEDGNITSDIEITSNNVDTSKAGNYQVVYKVVDSDGNTFTFTRNILVVEPTEAPTTEAPTTEAPTTEAPTTEVPTTEDPTTEAPTTEAPTTEVPTTEAPTTEAPTTEASTTEAPTTEAPTTEEPTTETPNKTSNDKSSGNKSTDGKSTDGKSTDGKSTDDKSTDSNTNEVIIKDSNNNSTSTTTSNDQVTKDKVSEQNDALPLTGEQRNGLLAGAGIMSLLVGLYLTTRKGK
ncbi:DUF5011 domain-containing protein [Macrococcus armenti]|uniref:immunoglobulin-like domain-containing protein n=1 Tax=Macrococcus armenti TaxID=2875764 RepID=UPI001CCC7D76|nr:immunoglobulin-like domain-containing protein [Macrococcus armenti]UBH22194.1 DUF5011 domain-containing protein [Macrococcus armenti]